MEKRQLATIGSHRQGQRKELKRGGPKETTAAKGNILYRGQPCLFLDQPIAKLKKKEKEGRKLGVNELKRGFRQLELFSNPFTF